MRVLPLLLAGCAAAYEGATPWVRDDPSGLEVRAVAMGPYAVGRPAPVRVEVRNGGKRPVEIDVQGLAHEPYRVDGAAYVNERLFGTVQEMVTIEPGRTLDLVSVDLAALFALLEPGDYVFQFGGLERWGPEHGEVPASPPLRIRLAPGTRSVRDEVLARLLPRVPPGWMLPYAEEAEGRIRLTYRRRDPGVRLEIEASCGVKDERRLLGTSKWGEVRLGAPKAFAKRGRLPEDATAEAQATRDVVPLLERALREALEIRP